MKDQIKEDTALDFCMNVIAVDTAEREKLPIIMMSTSKMSCASSKYKVLEVSHYYVNKVDII